MKTAKKDAPGNAVKNIEVLTRAYTVRDIEIREDNETRDGFTVLSGHAALFNTMSEDLGGFIEVIRPGAFAKTIAESDVRAHWNHERKYVLGRTKPGTLRLREDEIGLAFEIDLPDTRWAQDLAISIKRGDIDQMSFGFRAIRDLWTSRENQPDLRELIEVRLYEISPVTYPAYQSTNVDARSLAIFGESEIPTDEEDGNPAAPHLAVHPAGHSHRLRLLELTSR